MNQMQERNAVSWSSLIAASAKQGQSEEALELLYHMQKTGVRPDQFTFSGVLPACGNLVALEHGREVHGAIIVGGFGSDVVVGSVLVDMYVKTRTVEDARKLFDKMPERNVFSWIVMIVGYVQVGRVDEAAEFFRKMPERDLTAWNVMIVGFAHNERLREAKRLFRNMPERNVFLWTTMVTAYAQSGLNRTR